MPLATFLCELKTVVIYLKLGLCGYYDLSACCGYFGFHTSFCVVGGEIDVEVIAISFLCCQWIGGV